MTALPSSLHAPARRPSQTHPRSYSTHHVAQRVTKLVGVLALNSTIDMLRLREVEVVDGVLEECEGDA